MKPETFLDGSPIPPGYLEDVSRMVNLVCDIEDLIPDFELESYADEYPATRYLPR